MRKYRNCIDFYTCFNIYWFVTLLCTIVFKRWNGVPKIKIENLRNMAKPKKLSIILYLSRINNVNCKDKLFTKMNEWKLIHVSFFFFFCST